MSDVPSPLGQEKKTYRRAVPGAVKNVDEGPGHTVGCVAAHLATFRRVVVGRVQRPRRNVAAPSIVVVLNAAAVALLEKGRIFHHELGRVDSRVHT